MRSGSFRQGLKHGVPIGLGYFAVSFTFGMMAVADGLSIWQAVLISMTNVTSAGQFAGLDIMVMGGSYWEMALTQLIINLRYCLMSFSLAQKFRRDESPVLLIALRETPPLSTPSLLENLCYSPDLRDVRSVISFVFLFFPFLF